MFNDEYLIVDMLEAGAKGYLLKNASKQKLAEAVTTVFKGDAYYNQETSNKLTRLIADNKFDPFNGHISKGLSDREIEVVKLLCKEYTNKGIAAELTLSIRTVETHRENIQLKTGAKNSIGVVIYAIRHNIFQI